MEITEDEPGGAEAAALRRLGVLDDLLWRLRQEVLPERMIAAALGVLAAALGAEGAAVIAVSGEFAEPVRHLVGTAPELLAAAMPGIPGLAGAAPAAAATADHEYLACPCRSRFRPGELLLLWRAAREPPWSADDCAILDAASAVLRLVMEHEAIQQEIVNQAHTDPLTGLADRRAFDDDLRRRIDRLERDGLPGTLLLIDVDGLAQLNERAGLEAGDAALCALAARLRTTFRPTDLLARVGGGEFAIWLDGADELAAAERAETLRAAAGARLAGLPEPGTVPSLSIGIGARWPGEGEEMDALIARVDRVLREVKQTAPGTWRVSRG